MSSSMVQYGFRVFTKKNRSADDVEFHPQRLELA